jgi:hypothetical protein
MKTVTSILMLLTVCIVGCSSDQVILGNYGYIRPDAQIIVLNGDDNGKPLGVLYSGQYFWTYMSPGPYQLTGMFNYAGKYKGNGISTVVNLEAGKTYYFQVIQKPAHHTQDIVIKQHSDFKTMSAYKSSQPQPASKADVAIVYFYYEIPRMVNGLIAN